MKKWLEIVGAWLFNFTKVGRLDTWFWQKWETEVVHRWKVRNIITMNSRNFLSLNSRVRNKIIMNSRKTLEAYLESFCCYCYSFILSWIVYRFFIIFKYTSMMQVKWEVVKVKGINILKKLFTIGYVCTVNSCFWALLFPNARTFPWQSKWDVYLNE